MGVVVSAGSGKEFPLCPAGVTQGVCCDIIDKGMVETEYNGEKSKKHKIVLCWQTAELDPETTERFVVAKRYTASLHEKSALRKDLEGWRGRPFTSEELRGFDLDNVLGVNALLNIVHNQGKDGKTYANVAAIMPPQKGAAKLTVTNYVRVQDRKKDEEPTFQPSDEDVPF